MGRNRNIVSVLLNWLAELSGKLTEDELRIKSGLSELMELDSSNDGSFREVFSYVSSDIRDYRGELKNYFDERLKKIVEKRKDAVGYGSSSCY